jgi:hypothetical protein
VMDSRSSPAVFETSACHLVAAFREMILLE